MYTGLNLVIPMRADLERDAVAAAWQAGGGQVTRLDRYWQPPPLEPAAVRLYGPDVFVLLLAQLLGLELISPPDEALVTFPEAVLRRRLAQAALGETLVSDAFPAFVKSVVPKQFAARVYASGAELVAETAGLTAETAVFVAEPVRFRWEARAFVCAGMVLDLAADNHPLSDREAIDARALVRSLADRLPHACVVDVGWIEGRGLALVELNAAWGAGLNGCVAHRVLPAIAAATHLTPRSLDRG